ncbi:transposase [Ectothiorhodospira sp. BSL-9]|uniref:transposase n=1 Tax=Ectothiorhodospira sp. BSL-9 TaxID=1442136 RepID=UPI003528D01C
MTLTGQEFVRRFLQHILPKGLMRVRHYGFLANRCRGASWFLPGLPSVSVR